MTAAKTTRSEAAQQLHDRLIAFIEGGLAKNRLSHRELERMLGYGHGTIGNLLRGKSELRFRHLEEIGAVLGFTLEDALIVALGRSLPLKTVPLGDQFADQVARKVVTSLTLQGACACHRTAPSQHTKVPV